MFFLMKRILGLWEPCMDAWVTGIDIGGGQEGDETDGDPGDIGGDQEGDETDGDPGGAEHLGRVSHSTPAPSQ